MVKLGGEQYRIKSARCVATFRGARAFGLCALLASSRSALGMATDDRHGVGGRELRHRHARHAGAAGRFQPYALCQSRCAEGRPAGAGHSRHLRQPQSPDRPGPRRAANPRLRGREPDGARQRRGLHALRPAGQKRRDRRRQELRHLPSRSAGAVLGRPAGARRGRAVFLGLAARQGPSQPSPVLFQGRKGRSARPAHGAVRLRRRRRPRTAADPRPDADLAQARRRCRDLRGNLDDGADRLRALPRHRGQARRQRHADAQSRLLGPRPAGQSRLVEFRRDQARFLSRGQRPVRGLQARPL